MTATNVCSKFGGKWDKLDAFTSFKPLWSKININRRFVRDGILNQMTSGRK